MEYDLSILKHSQLFADIPSEKYINVLQCLDAQIRSFPTGQTIIAIGETIEKVGILLKGKAAIISYDESGNQININHCEAGDSFGETAACKNPAKSPLQITALENCTILFLGLAKLLEPSGCPYRAQMSANFMQNLIQENLFLNYKVQILAQKKLRDRIKLYLQMLPRQTNGTIRIPFNRSAWAEFLCVDRSALSRELGRLKTEGILSSDGAVITIMTPEFLD